MSSQPGFDHESLDVYQVSLDLVSFVHAILAQLPRGRAAVGDQLLRAAMSIPANIAEGSGEFARKEKVRFYRISLRSATECASWLDVAERLRALRAEQRERGKALLHRIVAMLLALIRRVETMDEATRGYPGPGAGPRPGPSSVHGPVPGPAPAAEPGPGTRLRDPT